MATAVATSVTRVMASAVASAAVAAGMATMTTVATAATIAAATTEQEGRSLLLTAHEGDSNQREKHRESKNNNTVHPRILQLLTGTVSGNYLVAVL
jgi:hypothetical protein